MFRLRAPAVVRLGARPLKSAFIRQVHYGSARHTARVRLLDRRELASGEETIARLLLRRLSSLSPATVSFFAILRSARTIAGGVVLDPDAGRTCFARSDSGIFCRRAPLRLTNLRPFCARSCTRRLLREMRTLLLKSNFSSEEIEAAVEGSARDQIFFQPRRIRRRRGLVARA